MLVKLISTVVYEGNQLLKGTTHRVDDKFIEHCNGCFVIVKDTEEDVKEFKAPADKMQRKVKTK